jgi:PAS domain S-box-containing protein
MKKMLEENFDESALSSNANLVATRFEEVFERMPMACFSFDSYGDIQHWNVFAENMLGLSASKPQSTMSLYASTDSRDGLWSLEFVRDVFRGIPTAGHEWLFRTAITERHLICDVFPVRVGSGKIIGAISSNLDITERKVAEWRAKRQALHLSQITCDLELGRVALERSNLDLRSLASKHSRQG